MMEKHVMEKVRKKNSRGGFTLIEMLAVVSIIVVLLSIVILSVSTISSNLKFQENTNYAKTIFMAAQSNLSAMRSNGELAVLLSEQVNDVNISESLRDRVGFPLSEWSAEYVFTSSEFTSGSAAADSYGLVLPEGSVESYIRDQKVIIEYNPVTGNVYGVFYSKNVDSLLRLYNNGKISRNEDDLKKMGIGYYCGSGLSSQKLDLVETAAKVDFLNGEEGIVSVSFNIPEGVASNRQAFVEGLEVNLTLTGNISGKKTQVKIMDSNGPDMASVTWNTGKTVVINYVMDSLTDHNSFANFAAGSHGKDVSLTEIFNQNAFTFLPGENLMIQADVSYHGTGTVVEIEPGILPGVNPMFEYLEPSGTPGKYILAVANGRNLQNLNALVPSIADAVELVVFTDDIYWNETVSYYNNVYGKGGTYVNAVAEAPARALPYFVPIHNELLLGTGWFDNNNQPTLQYGHDMTVSGGAIAPRDYADVAGNGNMVVGLNIDSTRYGIPGQAEYYVTRGYVNSAGTQVGGWQTVNYNFTGLFAYANTNISDLHVVNSVVKGLNFGSDANRSVATGSLLGVAGSNALLSNCGAYILTNPNQVNGAYNYTAMTGPMAYDKSGTQSWYGVSGEGAVGGLVGYSLSHRIVTDDLTDDQSGLAFIRCFAAVPVSGNMRGNANKSYGFTNGVGGLVGSSMLSNFFSCYASGDVLANGVYTSGKTTAWSAIDLDGETSMGAGGFAGTSHGSRFTNCFATGQIAGTGTDAGVGGFVGVMCYDGGFDYSAGQISQSLKQLTIFDSCYAVGESVVNGTKTENFAGGIASVKLGNYISADSKIYTDYYLMYAPYCHSTYGAGTFQGMEGASIPDIYQSGSGRFFYIYKDSYYLNRSQSGALAEPSTDDCGSAAGYVHFMGMIDNHQTSSIWTANQLERIKGWQLTATQNYLDTYFYYNSSLLGQMYWIGLDWAYRTELAEGYPDAYWVNATAATTYSYSINGGTYLFPMISGLNYYGDWPTFPLTGGLAYYEYYSDVSGIHAQFDREDSGNLLSAQELRDLGVSVTSDGYAVVAPSDSQQVTVQVGDTVYTLSATGSRYWQYGSETRVLYPLTQEILEAAARRISTEGYYVKLTIKIGQSSYDVYFNPNVANSQINPIMTSPTSHETPDKPTSAPNHIQIRTARQLAALSTMNNFWTQEYRYIQLLDINVGAYTASGYADAGEILDSIRNAGSIGTAAKPFLGSYTGFGGTQSQTTISGYTTSSTSSMGVFGVIGEGGLVKDLKILSSGATFNYGTLPLGGLVADVNYGTMNNVDLTVKGPVDMKANTGAGLLVGHSTGSIMGCDVRAEQAVTITAGNVGGAVAMDSGTISDCTLTVQGNFRANGSNAGGFVGAVEGTTVRNVSVTMKGDYLPSGSNAGGFVGLSTGGTYTGCAVSLAGTSGSGSMIRMGGFAGSASDAVFDNLNVTVSGTLAGDTVAGVLVHGENVGISNNSVTVSGAITGTTGAAGLAGTLDEESNISGSTVVVDSGSIRCDNGIAVGYVLTIQGQCTAGGVCLNGGTVSGKQAAGFVYNVIGEINGYSSVTGSGTVNGTDKAAGFAVEIAADALVAAARVTPALSQNPDAYWDISNAQLKITGGTVAGFVAKVEEGGKVQNCDALAFLSGSTISGFADANLGAIEGSLANITMTGGYAFVRDNGSGSVENCYGWYGDGEASCSTVASGSGYVGCYFADLDISEDEDTTTKSATVYDRQGHMTTMLPSELTSALGKLNGGTTGRWFIPGAFTAYPYTNAGSYPFPMLREHPGDWTVASLYSFGAVYYEKYDNGTYKYHVVGLSTIREGQSGVSFYGVDDAIQTGNCFDATGNIVSYGYLLFCKTDSDPFGGDLIGEKFTETDVILNAIHSKSSSNVYSLYQLNFNDKINFVSMGQTVEIHPYFADAIGAPGAFQIRTADQLASIGRVDGNFVQTRDISLSGNFNTIDSDLVSTRVAIAAGKHYDGGGFTIYAPSARNTWLSEVGGTLQNVVLAVGPVSSCVIDNVKTSGVVSNVTLMVVSDMPSNGAFFGIVSGKVHIPELKIQANAMNGMLVEQINGGSFTVDSVLATVSGSSVSMLFGEINGGEVKGGRMDLSQSSMKNHLFGELLKGAKLSGFDISVGNLRCSLIGSLTGTISGLKLDVVQAEVDSDTGMLVNSITTDTDAVGNPITVAISGCAVTVDRISADTVQFGIITGTLPRGASISDCVVTAGDISVDCNTVGSLVGINHGDLKNNTVDATINAKDLAVIGGLVGVNDGSILTNTAYATIRYTQTQAEKAEAIIGGLVGQMNGGRLSGNSNATTATGSIELVSQAAAANKRYYIVGGVVGKDSGIAGAPIYSSVSSGVTVDPLFGNSFDVSDTVADLAGKGPVGMFVGYVNKGRFSDCSSTAANSSYQFLGQIEFTPILLEGDGWFSHGTNTSDELFEMGNSTDIGAMGASKGYTALPSGAMYHSFAATLGDCVYLRNGSRMKQIIQTGDNLFTTSLNEIPGAYHPANVPGMRLADDATNQDFGMNTANRAETDFYYQNADGTFSRIYVRIRVYGNSYTYTLYTRTDNRYTEIEGLDWNVSGANVAQSLVPAGIREKIYVNAALNFASGQFYMITSDDGLMALALNPNTNSVYAKSVEEVDAFCLWTVTDGIWRNVGEPSCYLDTSKTSLIGTSGNTIIATGVGESGIQVKGSGYYVQFNGEADIFERSAAESSVLIYHVAQDPSTYKAAFTYYKTAQLCSSVAAD